MPVHSLKVGTRVRTPLGLLGSAAGEGHHDCVMVLANVLSAAVLGALVHYRQGGAPVRSRFGQGCDNQFMSSKSRQEAKMRYVKCEVRTATGVRASSARTTSESSWHKAAQ
jgi:hypothetical protein